MACTLVKGLWNAYLYPDFYNQNATYFRDDKAHEELLRVLKDVNGKSNLLTSEELEGFIKRACSSLYPLLDPLEEVPGFSPYKFKGSIAIDIFVRQELKELARWLIATSVSSLAFLLPLSHDDVIVISNLHKCWMITVIFIRVIPIALITLSLIYIPKLMILGDGAVISCFEAREKILKFTQTYNEREKQLIQKVYDKVEKDSLENRPQNNQQEYRPNIKSLLHLLQPRPN